MLIHIGHIHNTESSKQLLHYFG